jgi:iron complex transport system substrate-binding protein
MSLPNPKRILSLAQPVTDILDYMGFSDQVTTLKEYYEEFPLLSDRQKPEYWFSMAVGRAISQKADLVITLSVAQQDLHKRMKEKGIPALHLDPRCLRDVEDLFFQIGKAVGAQDRGRELGRDFAGGLSALKEKIPLNAYRPKLYCEEWNKPPSVAGNWWPDLMANVGAHYFPILPREISREVRIQEVIRFDPEIIIFSIYGHGLEFDPSEALKRIGWEDLFAVRKRRIFTVDSALLNYPVPRLIEGAKVIQSILGESFWGWPLVDPEQARRVVN